MLEEKNIIKYIIAFYEMKFHFHQPSFNFNEQ